MFKIPAWDDDTPRTNVKFAKKIKGKKDKASGVNVTDTISRQNEHHSVANAMSTEKIFNPDVSHTKSSRKRKHDNIANTNKKKARFSDPNANQVKENKAQKKKLDKEIKPTLFNELNKVFNETVVKRKTKHLKKLKTGLEKQNDFPTTENIVQELEQNTMKSRKKNVNHSDSPSAGKMINKRSYQKGDKKIPKISTNTQANKLLNVRKSNLDENGLFSTKKVLKKKSVNKIEKEKNNNIDNTDTSPENETNVVLFEKKQHNNFKREKLKAILQANKKFVPVTGSQLRERMLDRLKAAKFRYLNEKLYTSSGSEAQQLFQSDPSAFQTYHQGYQQQLKKWPVNPLDIIVKKILNMPKSHIIADMGCGEAALSKRVPHTVHSFDLVSTAPGVQACDMAHTPLEAGAVHACVYCLALMGTQLTQYLLEANRVLKPGGQLLIAEVESRFDDVEAFTRDVQRLGFKLRSLDKSHRVFFFLHFQKTGAPPVKKAKLPELTLNPCLYKKR